jgi:hypothetical protein
MDIPKDGVIPFARGLLDYLKGRHGGILAAIKESGAVSMELEEELTGAVEAYKSMNSGKAAG